LLCCNVFSNNVFFLFLFLPSAAASLALISIAAASLRTWSSAAVSWSSRSSALAAPSRTLGIHSLTRQYASREPSPRRRRQPRPPPGAGRADRLQTSIPVPTDAAPVGPATSSPTCDAVRRTTGKVVRSRSFPVAGKPTADEPTAGDGRATGDLRYRSVSHINTRPVRYRV